MCCTPLGDPLKSWGFRFWALYTALWLTTAGVVLTAKQQTRQRITRNGVMDVKPPDPPPPYVSQVRITHDPNWDPALDFYRLHFSDGSAIVVMGDRDLPVIKWLGGNTGRKVPLKIGEER